MATSRTGTAKWKRIRQQRIRRARIDGITNCPECGVMLDYALPGLRNSAEVDHVIPHSQGGQDTLDNTQILCRRCNASMGDKRPKTASNKRTLIAQDLPTSQPW